MVLEKAHRIADIILEENDDEQEQDTNDMA